MRQVSTIPYVLFDAVGTLIYADPPVASVYCGAGRRHGVELPHEEVAHRFQAAFIRYRHDDQRASAEGERRRWQKVIADVFHEWPHAHDGILGDLWEHFSQPTAWRLFGDAASTLAELQSRGARVGVASNFDERLVSVCRGHAALAELELFWSSDIGYSKPHPQFFARVAERLGLSSKEILLVGDDWEADFQGALAAGWQAVFIDRSGGPTPRSDACRSLAELPSRLFGSVAIER